MSKLLEYDPFSGLTEYFHKTDTGFSIETRQDVEPILNRNQATRSLDSGNWKGNWHEIACIPHVLILQWNKELGGDCLAKENRKWFMNKVKDIEYSKIRTKGGKL